MFGTLSFMLRFRTALLVAGCLACFGAGIGVAALCAEPAQTTEPPMDPIWAVPSGESLEYIVDAEGRISIDCLVYNSMTQPVSLSDVYLGGDPTVRSIEIEQTSLPAGASGTVTIIAVLDETCRAHSMEHTADIDMIFRWERGSALITLPVAFRTEPAGESR